MKKIILVLPLQFFLILCCLAQKELVVKEIEFESKSLFSGIGRYVEDLGRDGLERDRSLDSVAAERTDYFLEVLGQNTKKSTLSKLLDQIPTGSRGHKRAFGNPEFFKEPKDIVYPSSLPFVVSSGLKVKAEIMQEALYSITSKRNFSNSEIVARALNNFHEEEGLDFMLKHYLNSPSHHSAIVNYAREKAGISVKALISKEWIQQNSVWRYEVLFYSLAVFGE